MSVDQKSNVRFKVGDRVRLIGKIFSHEITGKGAIGTISYIENNRNISIDNIDLLDDVEQICCYFDIELAYKDIKNTKIARKVYPKAELLENGELRIHYGENHVPRK